jgi:Cu2+-exporting ATPase
VAEAPSRLAILTPRERDILELVVSGLTCGACVWLVEQALAQEPDVLRARASLSARRLTIGWRGPAERGRARQARTSLESGCVGQAWR